MSALESGFAISSENGLRSATVCPIAARACLPASSGQVSGMVSAIAVCETAQAIARRKLRLPRPKTGCEDAADL